MPDCIESLLFNNETTHKTDYRYGKIKTSVATPPILKQTRERIKARKLINVQTLTEWPSVPFNLFIHLKDVVRTNPKDIQQECMEPPDLEREDVQKTRPRLTMAPAVAVDDIHDQEIRNILVNDTYLSTTQKTLREGVRLEPHEKMAPVLELPSPANPVTPPKLRAHYVSREWRPDTVTWDGQQLRTNCDPSREFYRSTKHISSAGQGSTASSKKN